jgi:hypothetical protein
MEERRHLIVESIPLLGRAFSADLAPEVITLYADAMDDLSELQIRHAFKRAVKSWRPNYGRTFPAPAELREYAEEIAETVAPAEVTDIDPENLPKGWTMKEWKAAKLTLKVSRANGARPLPPDEDNNRNETRTDYARRIIVEMRKAVHEGANSFSK